MILDIILQVNALSPVLGHTLRNDFLETARRQLRFGLVPNVLLGLKTQHITSARCSVFQSDELRGTVHPTAMYGVL